MMLPLPGDVADKIEAFNRGEQPNGINDWRDLLSEGDVATVLLALRNDEMKLKRGAEPSPLEAAKKLLISAAVGSCTCNTKSPELIWHAPDCRYAVLMMALENVEIAATPVAEAQGPPHWRTWNGAVLDAGQRCVTEAKHLPDLPQEARYSISQDQMDRLHGAAHSGAMIGGDAAYNGCLKVEAILAEIASSMTRPEEK